MIDWPANSWLFWLAAGISTAFLFRLSRQSSPATPAAALPGKPQVPINAPRRLRRRMVAAWIAAVLAAALTPSFMKFWLFGDTGWRDLAPIDQVLILTGVCIFAFALVLMAVGLPGDRSRGRPRCPCCWYDMKGAPSLTCPECGKTVRSERSLFKTRRSWKGLAIAAVLVLLGLSMAAKPAATSPNWPSFVPGPILALLDWPNSWNLCSAIASKGCSEQSPNARMSVGSLTAAILRFRCRRLLDSGTATEVDNAVWMMNTVLGPLSADQVNHLLDSNNGKIRHGVLWACFSACAKDTQITGRIVAATQDPNVYVANAAQNALLFRARADPGQNVTPLLKYLSDSAASNRWSTIEVLDDDLMKNPLMRSWAAATLDDPAIGGHVAVLLLRSDPQNQMARDASVKALRLGTAQRMDNIVANLASLACQDSILLQAVVDAQARSRVPTPALAGFRSDLSLPCRLRLLNAELQTIALSPADTDAIKSRIVVLESAMHDEQRESGAPRTKSPSP